MARIKKFKDVNPVNEAMVYTPDVINNAINNLFKELCIDHATDKQRNLLHTAIKAICVLEGSAIYSDENEPNWTEEWDAEKNKMRVHSRTFRGFPKDQIEPSPLTIHKGEIKRTIKDYEEIERKYAELMSQH